MDRPPIELDVVFAEVGRGVGGEAFDWVAFDAEIDAQVRARRSGNAVTMISSVGDSADYAGRVARRNAVWVELTVQGEEGPSVVYIDPFGHSVDRDVFRGRNDVRVDVGAVLSDFAGESAGRDVVESADMEMEGGGREQGNDGVDLDVVAGQVGVEVEAHEDALTEEVDGRSSRRRRLDSGEALSVDDGSLEERRRPLSPVLEDLQSAPPQWDELYQFIGEQFVGEQDQQWTGNAVLDELQGQGLSLSDLLGIDDAAVGIDGGGVGIDGGGVGIDGGGVGIGDVPLSAGGAHPTVVIDFAVVSSFN
ncbi:hypothetical protein, partial [Frankia sp. Cj3]|uniref:hypothetical protein n=1 Tax=Frankia sp. Cj3 TaxID=2880976 RepID=UPI001EF5E1AB